MAARFAEVSEITNRFRGREPKLSIARLETSGVPLAAALYRQQAILFAEVSGRDEGKAPGCEIVELSLGHAVDAGVATDPQQDARFRLLQQNRPYYSPVYQARWWRHPRHPESRLGDAGSAFAPHRLSR